jgi:hypothetical protein
MNTCAGGQKDAAAGSSAGQEDAVVSNSAGQEDAAVSSIAGQEDAAVSSIAAADWCRRASMDTCARRPKACNGGQQLACTLVPASEHEYVCAGGQKDAAAGSSAGAKKMQRRAAAWLQIGSSEQA